MVCPYAVHRHVVQQTVYEYDENGNMKMQETVEHNTAEFAACVKTQCGAYRDGRCHYYENYT